MGKLFWLDLLVFLLSVHIISIRILNGKLCIGRAIIACSAIFPCMVLTIVFYYQPIYVVFFFCSILLSYIAPMFTLKGIKKIRIIYIALLYFGASNALIVSCNWIIRLFTANASIILALDVLLQCILLAVCVIFSINSVFYRTSKYIVLIPMKLKVLLLISVWFSVLFAFSVSSNGVVSQRTIWLTLSEISAAAIVITVGIMWPFIILGNSLNTSYRAMLNSLDGQMQAQLKQYEFMVKANESIRKFKHDFDNVKIGLVGHLQNNDPLGALRYLEECKQSIQSEYISYKTGNLIADALLSEKQTLAKAYNVHIIFDGLIPSGGVSPIDLCVVLGNLLDNALEACVELPETKTVSVSSNVNNGFLFLEISNPVKEDIPIQGNTLDTSKKDKENHGTGLISIQNSIRKYDGTMVLSCINKMFLVNISIYLKTQN